MSTEKKYREWDLDLFKQGWPAEWVGSPAKFVAHVEDAYEDQCLVFKFIGGTHPWKIGAVDKHGNDDRHKCSLRLLARELDPHPDNKDGLYRDQIGEGWRIKGHGEATNPQDEWWDEEHGGWRRLTGPVVMKGFTYRTRDPLPEPMFKVGDRVRHNDGEIGTVIKSDGKVTVEWPSLRDAPVTYDPDGCWFFTKLTTHTVNLGPEDIVLGKTVVRVVCGECRYLVRAANNAGLWFHSDAKQATWEELRGTYEISFDHGTTWQKAEKEVEG